MASSRRRAVTPEDVGDALHYAQRILENPYGDGSEVENVLKARGRIT